MVKDARELFGVPNVLGAFPAFVGEAGTNELATQLHRLVVASGEELAVRGLHGLLARYSDPETAREKVRRGQRENGNPEHYAVVNEGGNVVGGASIYPELPLRKLRLPIPPALARGVLATDYPYATPNIHAWIDKEHTGMLSDAYSDLLFRTGTLWRTERRPKAWTAEPTRSPKHIHVAIGQAGLQKVATRRFDDGESRARVPPRSTLYARLYSEWFTAHGALKELATGGKSWSTIMDEGINEQMSRNPKGG